jgi:pimeloyl-ACP methyl ester carboxylesterase
VTAAASGGATEGRDISVGDVRLHIREAGSPGAPLLILLHGFPESGRAWRKLMRPLAGRGFHVVAPDLRGYGASDAPDGVAQYRLELLVDDMIGLANALGADIFTLAGHDWGGIVAWAVAARHPDRLKRLIILNAPHPDTIDVRNAPPPTTGCAASISACSSCRSPRN